MEKHWLVRPKTIRLLWIAMYVVLAVTVLLQIVFHVHGEFGVDEAFGFNAWYGLGACALMVVGAKILGTAIKRKDNYYD
ncbi:MAG: hypothetical protein RLN70_05180 [Rhodospirillaceae bacterium]